MAGPSGGINYGPPTLQAIMWAKAAGFKDLPLVIIVCIARAESGLVTHGPDNVNADQWKSRDRGILQINNHYHPEVSDACAYDGACSFREAWVISSHGTNFSAWKTYTSSAYAAYASYTGSLAGVTIPANLKTAETNAQNQNLTNIIPGGDAIAGIGTFIDKLNSLMSDPTRIVKGLIGLVLLLVGLALMVKQLVPASVIKGATKLLAA